MPLGSDYFVRVYYRPTTGSGAWTAYGQSAGSFSVTSVAPIGVTAPTAGSIYFQGTPTGLPVTWTTAGAVSAGEFSIWVIDPVAGGWYGGDIVAANGTTSYSGSTALNMPLSSTYFVRVYYRPTAGSGAWTDYGQSAGSFTVN